MFGFLIYLFLFSGSFLILSYYPELQLVDIYFVNRSAGVGSSFRRRCIGSVQSEDVSVLGGGGGALRPGPAPSPPGAGLKQPAPF